MTISQGEKASQSRRAVIVGGGPAGTLMALYLASMNWKVSLYECRDGYRQLEDTSSRRTYNIVLSQRGLTALKQAKVNLPSQQIVLLKGNVRHTKKGAKKSQGFTESISVNRNVLAENIYESGRSHFPEQINYYFGHCLEAIDFEYQVATFRHQLHQVDQEFDLLVGADGVRSRVRELMVKQISGFDCHQNQDEMTFKICQLGKASNLAGAAKDWGECFHVWPSSQGVTLLAPPNPDGSLTGILILPQQGTWTFEKIRSKEDVEALFTTKFPDIWQGKPLTEQMVSDFLTQKASIGGITTTCNTFSKGDSVVLVGDAAHSVWPSLGQGCNVALESCRILAEILATHDGNRETALPAYTLARKADTDAIGRMSEQGFGDNRRAGNAVFFGKMIVLFLLHKLFPFWFALPALVQMNQANVSYGTVEAQWKKQGKQLWGIVIVTLAMLALLITNKIWFN